MTSRSRQVREPPRFVDFGFTACKIQRLAEGINADFQMLLIGGTYERDYKLLRANDPD